VLPEAVQIADRFHITKNLLEALNDTMKAFMPEVIEIPSADLLVKDLTTEMPMVAHATEPVLLKKRQTAKTYTKPNRTQKQNPNYP
jgi:hypothetical protein